VITVNSVDENTLKVQVYDIAGELLKKVPVVPNGVNQVKADFSNVASGMYFVMVELINSEGGLEKRQALKIVIAR
jgi:hypothetical protein